jgi:hypothetical protein
MNKTLELVLDLIKRKQVDGQMILSGENHEEKKTHKIDSRG